LLNTDPDPLYIINVWPVKHWWIFRRVKHSAWQRLAVNGL